MFWIAKQVGRDTRKRVVYFLSCFASKCTFYLLKVYIIVNTIKRQTSVNTDSSFDK